MASNPPSGSGNNNMQPPQKPIGKYKAAAGGGSQPTTVIDRPIYPVDSTSQLGPRSGISESKARELLNNVGPLGLGRASVTEALRAQQNKHKSASKKDSNQGSSSSQSGGPST